MLMLLLISSQATSDECFSFDCALRMSELHLSLRPLGNEIRERLAHVLDFAFRHPRKERQRQRPPRGILANRELSRFVPKQLSINTYEMYLLQAHTQSRHDLAQLAVTQRTRTIHALPRQDHYRAASVP